MSWEGYEENLCENGHYFASSSYMYSELGDLHCPYCEAEAVWGHTIDETNGAYIYDATYNEEYDSCAVGVSFRPILAVKWEAPVCEHCDQTTGPIVYFTPDEDGWEEPKATDRRLFEGLLTEMGEKYIEEETPAPSEQSPPREET